MTTILKLVIFVFGAAIAGLTFAAGVIETATGDVRAGVSAGAATTAKVSQRVTRATTVVTGPKSSAQIRFEDGQVMAIHENSEFRIADYAFTADKPAGDKFSFELVKGALRSVTATTTRRNPTAYELKTTNATMGVRGTDFMVAIVNPTYFQVINGAVTVTNTAGTAAFGAGAAGTAATTTTLAVTVPLSALPAPVAATFSQLAGLTITVTGSIGAATASAQAAGAITPAMAGAIGAAAIAAGIVVNNANNDDQVSGVTTSTTTSTR